MRSRASFAPLVLLLTLGAAACTGSTEDDSGPSQANPLDADENAIVGGLNQLRMANGVPQVTVCTSLNVSASGHSDDMRDHGFVAEKGTDGSDVRTRSCAAGYTSSCGTSIPMAELVASGNATGDATLNQWEMSETSKPILLNPAFVVVGVGGSLGADGAVWTLDMGGKSDPSCN